MQPRLRPLSEAECYARCYAGKTDTVRLVRLEARRLRYELPVSGEALRLQLDMRLDLREQDELAKPEAA